MRRPVLRGLLLLWLAMGTVLAQPAPVAPRPGDTGMDRAVDISHLMRELAEHAWEEVSYPVLYTRCTEAPAPPDLTGNPDDRVRAGRAVLAYLRGVQWRADEDINAWFLQCVKRMLKHAGPRAQHFSKSEFAQFARVRPYGVGLTVQQRDADWIVIKVFPRAPAEAAGIEAGDTLVSVDGVDARTLAPGEIQEVLRDAGPTQATLAWRSAKQSGALVKRTMMRDVVTFDERVVVLNMGDHTYISMPRFHESTPRNMLRALRTVPIEAQWPKVLDLRGNQGGLLDTPQWLLAAFGQHGKTPPWAPMKFRAPGREQPPFSALDIMASRRVLPAGWTAPTAEEQQAWAAAPRWFILIDGQTASGAAWLAQALREINGAVLVGTPSRPESPGLDLVQTLRSSDLLYAVRYEAGKLVLPSGRIMQEGALVPDVIAQPQPLPAERETSNAIQWLADPLYREVKARLR